MNERTNTLLFNNIIFQTLFSKGLMLVVCERRSWRREQTVILTKSSSSTIAALLSHLGWVAQPWVTEGLATLSRQADSHAGILSSTDSNWLEPPQAPGYIIV